MEKNLLSKESALYEAPLRWRGLINILNYFKASLIATTILFSFCTCSVNINPPLHDQKENEEKQKIIEAYSIMKEEYLWNHLTPEVSPSQFRYLEKLLDSMRYKKLDKWSFVANENDFNEIFDNKRFFGSGYKVKRDKNGGLQVAFVYKDSPAEKAGLRRGDRIIKINDTIFSEIDVKDQWKVVEEKILHSGITGSTYKLTYESSDSLKVETTVNKRWINLTNNNQKNIFHIDGQKIGYLYFHTFLDLSVKEISTYFSYFRTEKIDDLIIDLRYNTGGYLLSAETLATLIAGGMKKKVLFIRGINNNSEEHETYYIENMEGSLALKRIFIIISESTCSASEALINGLTPYIDTILIGASTCGKPFGFRTFKLGDRVLAPITTSLKNARNEGDYTDGISPICNVDDDFGYKIGDREEASIKEALYFIKHNKCSSVGNSQNADRDRMTREIGYKGLHRIIKAF